MRTHCCSFRFETVLLRAGVLVGLLALLLPTAALAQDRTVGEPPMAARQFAGASNRDGAVVRSGPTSGHLAVLTLARDQEVIVVGVDAEFLRILPPDGAFCMVPKARVEPAAGEGPEKLGRITANCAVRAGSRLSGMPGETTATLAEGEQIMIVGEDSTYYHIKPPKNVFLYVHNSELKRTREVTVRDGAAGWTVAEIDEAPPTATDDAAGGDEPMTDEPLAQADQDVATTAPSSAVASIPDAVIPTTRPAILNEFSELDSRYNEAAKLPLEEQPLEDLKREYGAMLERATADAGMQSLVPAIKARMQTIELRQEALQDLLAMQAMRQQMSQRQQALEAEQQELAERAQNAKVVLYAAVGQLRPSTLQVGSGSLYRLCDPATGRTMIYLRAEGDKAKELAKHLEQFVGVKGETQTDKEMNLKFIKITEVAAVDPAQVFKNVAAELIPPSLTQNAAAGD